MKASRPGKMGRKAWIADTRIETGDQCFNLAAGNMNQVHGAGREGYGMSHGKRGDHLCDLQEAAANARATSPSRTNGDQRRGQQQREQEQKMIGAFGDVAHAEF